MMNNVKSSAADTYECDALVVGSGCAGLSAAVTAGHHGLSVLIVEKEPRFGGTTARSGGWLWIPGTKSLGPRAPIRRAPISGMRPATVLIPHASMHSSRQAPKQSTFSPARPRYASTCR